MERVTGHLLGLDPFHNAPLDVLRLQVQVLASVSSHPPRMDEAEIWNSLTQGITSLNPSNIFLYIFLD